MTEKSIIFSAAMVRALLAGTKTQTRRVACNGTIPAQYIATTEYEPGRWRLFDAEHPHASLAQYTMPPCPYGQPGDRLWVRETFAKIDGQTRPWIETDYRATYAHGDRLGDHLGMKKRWTPAIHMPRAASRITLEITEVRVERLQAISEADARAEGVVYDPGEGGTFWVPGAGCTSDSAVDAYRKLFESINGPGSWDANPWVWAISFWRIAP
jgi:hypothetical protein